MLQSFVRGRSAKSTRRASSGGSMSAGIRAAYDHEGTGDPERVRPRVRRVTTANGPLAGMRVVELGVWVAGPGAGGILADWGADVVKIEPPEGDPARTFGRMLGGDLPNNPVFELDNRSKRSVVLDLSDAEDRARALALIDRADVFLTNIRATALRRLGLDSDALLERNNRLVYALITGYGVDGPDSDRPAYDIAAYWA